MNDEYTDGIICPFEIPDQWQYEYDRQWFVDPTLRFVCTKFRDAEEAQIWYPSLESFGQQINKFRLRFGIQAFVLFGSFGQQINKFRQKKKEGKKKKKKKKKKS